MSVLKKLAGETALYGLSSIVGRSLNYLLVPIHTAIFLEDDYGTMTVFYAYVAFLNIIYTYGMETTYFRFASKDARKALEVYNQTLSSILLSTLVFSGSFIFFSSSIARALGQPDKQSFVVWLILIISIDAVLAIPYARLRHERKAKKFAYTKIINISLNVFLNIFFLVFCRQIYLGHWFPSLRPLVYYIYDPSLGIGYIFLANLIANAFVFLLLYQSFLSFRFQIRWKTLRPMLHYAYPLLLMGLAGMINQMIDKIMLKTYLPDDFYSNLSSTGAVGVYGACAKLSIFMMLAIQAFKYAAEPFFFSQAQDKKSPALFAKVMKYFVIVCVILWLLVSLNVDLFKIIFLQQKIYHQGILVVPILLLANLFLGVYYNLSIWFKLTDQTYYGTWIAIMGAIITLALNFLLIPLTGYMGAALTVLITYFSMTVVCYLQGQKHYPIPYDLRSAFVHIFLGGALITVSFSFPISSIILSVLFNWGLFSVYALFVFFTEKDKLLKKKSV